MKELAAILVILVVFVLLDYIPKRRGAKDMSDDQQEEYTIIQDEKARHFRCPFPFTDRDGKIHIHCSGGQCWHGFRNWTATASQGAGVAVWCPQLASHGLLPPNSPLSKCSMAERHFRKLGE